MRTDDEIVPPHWPKAGGAGHRPFVNLRCRVLSRRCNGRGHTHCWLRARLGGGERGSTGSSLRPPSAPPFSPPRRARGWATRCRYRGVAARAVRRRPDTPIPAARPAGAVPASDSRRGSSWLWRVRVLPRGKKRAGMSFPPALLVAAVGPAAAATGQYIAPGQPGKPPCGRFSAAAGPRGPKFSTAAGVTPVQARGHPSGFIIILYGQRFQSAGGDTAPCSRRAGPGPSWRRHGPAPGPTAAPRSPPTPPPRPEPAKQVQTAGKRPRPPGPAVARASNEARILVLLACSVA